MEGSQDTRRTVDLVLEGLAVLAVVYHLISSHFLIVSANRHMNIHLAFALSITFLSALRNNRGRVFNVILLVAAIFSTGWVHLNIEYLEMRAGFPNQPIQVLIVAALLMVLVLVCVRRAFGWVLTIIILIFITYPYLGRWLPGSFHVPPLNPATILFRQTIGSMGTGGIYGNLLMMSVTAIFLFIVFGGLLQSTGATRFVMHVGRLAGRRLAGGVGLTAVVSSCLLGTITGAIAANIAATGSFTIPLMKKAGYRKSQAAAIEAMASTGGMIMPPVMGYVAFLMIAMIGIPYFELCITTAIPALLYYLCGGLYVQFQAAKLGLKSDPERIDRREMLIFAPMFIVPLVVLVTLLALNKPLDYSVSLTIVIMILLSLVYKPSRAHFLVSWRQAVTGGVVVASQVALICAGMSMLLESMNMIALLLKIPALVLELAGGSLLVALLLSMLASLILGSGVSATAAYMLVAIVIGPALIQMGLDIVQAHFFAFWFACIGFLTPPIAIGAAIAARIADSRFWPTAVEATKVASAAFVIPFIAIWYPILMFRPSEPLLGVLGLFGAVALILSLQVTVCGQFLTKVGPGERIFYLFLTLFSFLSLAFHFIPGIVTGIALTVSGTVVQLKRMKKEKK